jgi:hypothetical protein
MQTRRHRSSQYALHRTAPQAPQTLTQLRAQSEHFHADQVDFIQSLQLGFEDIQEVHQPKNFESASCNLGIIASNWDYSCRIIYLEFALQFNKKYTFSLAGFSERLIVMH